MRSCRVGPVSTRKGARIGSRTRISKLRSIEPRCVSKIIFSPTANRKWYANSSHVKQDRRRPCGNVMRAAYSHSHKMGAIIPSHVHYRLCSRWRDGSGQNGALHEATLTVVKLQRGITAFSLEILNCTADGRRLSGWSPSQPTAESDTFGRTADKARTGAAQSVG